MRARGIAASVRSGRGDRAIFAAAASFATMRYLLAYRADPSRPVIGGTRGWLGWFDQGLYFKAARAWSRGDLAPSAHWYLPGYPLLGAGFVRAFSVHAFLVPDLACLLLSLWLFARVAARLAPSLPHAGAVGAVLFALTDACSPRGLLIWVVPWSTSGSAPLVYAALLATLDVVARPAHRVSACLAALAGGLVIAFRPTDVAPILLASGVGVAVAVLRRWPGWRDAGLLIAAFAGGLAVALLAVGLAYDAVWGMRESTYLRLSAAIGLDWGLLPLHWVTLVLDARPLLDDGPSLIQAFPWIAPGVIGMLTIVLVPSRPDDRLMHLVVVLAAGSQIVLYLAYRDLHPTGLFRFSNYHYFKWIYPFFPFYAVLLVRALCLRPGRRIAVAAIAAGFALALLPWRAHLRIVGPTRLVPVTADDRVVDLRVRLRSVRDGVLVPTDDNWFSAYFGIHRLTLAGHDYRHFDDFRLFPVPGGVLLVPLRPLGDGLARLTFAGGLAARPSVAPLIVRQVIGYGVPCWLPWRVHGCAPIAPLLGGGMAAPRAGPVIRADRPTAREPSASAAGGRRRAPSRTDR